MSDDIRPEETFSARMGKFFLFLSFVLFVIFALTDQAKQPDFDYFFSSMISLAVGLYLRRQAPPTPPAERFRTLRRWQARRKGKQE